MQELSTVERHKAAVAGDGFGLGIAFSDRLLDETHRLTLLSPATQGEQSKPAPPAFILETDGPFGAGLGHRHQSVASPLLLSYRGPEKRSSVSLSAICLREGAKASPGWSPLRPAFW